MTLKMILKAGKVPERKYFYLSLTLGVVLLLVVLLQVITKLNAVDVREYHPDTMFLLKEILQGPVPQDDRRIVKYIREVHLIAPVELVQINDTKQAPSNRSQDGEQDKIIDLLKNKTEGFFVSYGESDGANHSTTHYLEQLGWEGLLVEPDPRKIKVVKSGSRKIWIADVCLSRHPYPEKETIDKWNLDDIMKTKLNDTKDHLQIVLEVQCLPLFSILTAVNQLAVDFLSLDMKGAELKVLRTIPFDSVDIKMMSINCTDAKKEKLLLKFLEDHGYALVTKVVLKNGGNNLVVVRTGNITYNKFREFSMTINNSESKAESFGIKVEGNANESKNITLTFGLP